MTLSEIYIREIYLREFWGQVKEDFEEEESVEGIQPLLDLADKLIFEKFNIKTTDKVYFIAGSARLYLFPKLKEAFNLSSTIGDLDIIIPSRELWVNAGLKKEYESGGIYRPTNKYNIEVFTEWNPAKAGDDYGSVKVRPTEEILKDADLIGNHYYMDLKDVAEYKTKLNREKEKELVDLISDYNRSSEDKFTFLKKIIQTIGVKNTRNFFGDEKGGLMEFFS